MTSLFLIAAVLLTSTLSGVFGMVGGMVLLWLLLLAFPVTTGIAVQGILQLCQVTQPMIALNCGRHSDADTEKSAHACRDRHCEHSPHHHT